MLQVYFHFLPLVLNFLGAKLNEEIYITIRLVTPHTHVQFRSLCIRLVHDKMNHSQFSTDMHDLS